MSLHHLLWGPTWLVMLRLVDALLVQVIKRCNSTTVVHGAALRGDTSTSALGTHMISHVEVG